MLKKKIEKKKKKEEKKAATVQRLKPKHCSYSANWTNQIGTVAIVQNLKNSKRKKEIKKKKIKGLNKPNVYCTGIGAFYRVRLSFRSIISHFKINEWCVAHKWSKGRKKDTSNPIYFSSYLFFFAPLFPLQHRLCANPLPMN